MNLPTFELESAITDVAPPGTLVFEGPHDKAASAFQRRYEISEGHIILTDWHGLLHEVIYQTPLDDEAASMDRNNDLFIAFGDGQAWDEILDNGFGKTYRRADVLRYALWSYAMDFTTIGTMAFHDVKWG